MIGTIEERREKLEEIFLPWEEMTIWSRFEQMARRYCDRVYIICDGKKYTYGQVKKTADQVALGLDTIGVKEQDHIAVFMRNRAEYVILTYAIAKIGAIKVPLNVGLKEKELIYSIKMADAKWAVTDQHISKAVMGETGLKKVVLLQNCGKKREFVSWKNLLRYGNNRKNENKIEMWVQKNNGELISDIMFTSGSGGNPKGILIHHDMLLRSAYGTCYTRGIEQGRCMYVPIPFFHMFAYVEGLLTAMLIGGTIIISSEKYNAHRALDMMKKYQANDIICVSYIMLNILEKGKPEAKDYPDMYACYFASTCPKDTWKRAKEAFGLKEVSTGYGMTECGSTTTMIAPEDADEKVEQCHGKLKKSGRNEGSFLKIKIVSTETGANSTTGKIGEICCKGSTVTKGYYKNPDANKNCFDDEGWFHTGDLGILDEAGYLEYLGRKDDTYKINGENVSPFYLDSIIGQCEFVKAVETVGITHPKCGSVGVAFVEASTDSEEREQKIREYCQQHLARFQVPKYIIFGKREEWPTTDTGKIKKRELRHMAEKMLN